MVGICLTMTSLFFVRIGVALSATTRLSACSSIIFVCCVLFSCSEKADANETKISELSAVPAKIRTGQSTTIRWRVSGADRLTLSGTTATADSLVIVSPSRTTTYTLRAITKEGDTIARSITIAVAEDSAFATVRIDPNHLGYAIKRGFLGFSHEWGQAQLMMGDPAIGTNTIYRQLLSNLTKYGGGPVSLRIGGATTDLSGEPAANTLTPLERLYDDMDSSVPGVSYLLSLNLGANDVGLATRQANAIVAGLPEGSVQALELGNEPDAYVANNYRAEGYNMTDYLYEWGTFTETILDEVPDCPLFMGPSGAGFQGIKYVDSLPVSNFGSPDRYRKFLRDHQQTIGVISQHAYAASSRRCGGNAKPGILLEPASATECASRAVPYAAVTRAAGKPYRITELNSIRCAGEPGVSDAFEASLWIADVLFEYAKLGAAGVNVHSNNWNTVHGWDAHAAFLFDIPQKQYLAANSNVQPPAGYKFPRQYELRKVLPLYYGMLFFAEATANRARLLPVEHNSLAKLKVWATKDPESGLVKVAIINKDTAVSGKILLRLPGYRTGEVKRMVAPSYHSVNGITIAGQTFDGSRDGLPIGTAYAETLTGNSGVFEISVGATSAVLVRLKK